MQYWANINGVQHGPVEREELRGLGVTSLTYVWREGLEDWVQARDLADLADIVVPAAPAAEPAPAAQVVPDVPPVPSVPEPAIEVKEPEIKVEPASVEASSHSESKDIVVETTVTVKAPDAVPPEPVAPTYVPPQPIPQPYNPPYAGIRQPVADEEEPKCPPSNLVWAILATILCCQVTGVVAIIFGAMVGGKYREGDYEAAKKYSDRAAIWCMVSLVIGIVYVPFALVLGYLSGTM